MRLKVLFPLFILFVISCGKQYDSKFKIDSYLLDTKYDTLSGNLSVKTNIQIEMFDLKDNTIKLLFSQLADISKIQFINNRTNYPTDFKFKGKTFTVNIPKEIQNLNHINLYIEYKYIPHRYLNPNNNLLSLIEGENWYPSDGKDSSNSILKIETPLNFMAYSSGNLIEQTSDSNHSIFKWERKIGLDLILIILPDSVYRQTKKEIEGKEICFYFKTKDTIKTNMVIREFYKTYIYCNKKFGEYRNKYLRIFESPDESKRANNPSSSKAFIYFGSEVFDYIYDPFAGVSWVAHETIHQWIGSGVKINESTKLNKFLEESLPEYIRYLYIEDQYGKDSMEIALNKLKVRFLSNVQKGIEYRSLSRADGSTVIQYFTGPLVFHYVRKQIGRENFINFVKTLYNKYYLKQIDYNIFKSELSKYDPSGKVIKRMEEMTEMKGMIPER